jgi:hypothetical protein
MVKTIDRNNLKHVSTGEPTYWPSDRRLRDHSLVLIKLTAHALNQEKQPSLSNRHKNWDYFRRLINKTLNVSLKTEGYIEAAVQFFNYTIKLVGWNVMPEHTDTLKAYTVLY